jgi:hypothetical protein
MFIKYSIHVMKSAIAHLMQLRESLLGAVPDTAGRTSALPPPQQLTPTVIRIPGPCPLTAFDGCHRNVRMSDSLGVTPLPNGRHACYDAPRGE